MLPGHVYKWLWFSLVWRQPHVGCIARRGLGVAPSLVRTTGAGCDGSHSSQSCTLEVLVCARYRGPGLVPLARWVPGGTQVAPVYCQAYQGLYAPSGCTWGHHVLLRSGGHVQFSTYLGGMQDAPAWRGGVDGLSSKPGLLVSFVAWTSRPFPGRPPPMTT